MVCSYICLSILLPKNVKDDILYLHKEIGMKQPNNVLDCDRSFNIGDSCEHERVLRFYTIHGYPMKKCRDCQKEWIGCKLCNDTGLQNGVNCCICQIKTSPIDKEK